MQITQNLLKSSVSTKVLQGGVVRGCLAGRACSFGGKAFHDGAVHGACAPSVSL